MIKGDQSIQAAQYSFPYHYIPQNTGRLFLSRHWSFAASYIAALDLVAEHVVPLAHAQAESFRHIDIGCGDGALLYHLTSKYGLLGSRLAGVDTDARSIEWARLFNPDAKLFAVNLAEIAGDYSSASLIEVMEHVPPEALPRFLEKAASLLRPGGLMIITVPSVEKPVATKHFQHFSMATLRDLLAPHFEHIEIRGFERGDAVTRLLMRLRDNGRVRIDAPQLNRLLVQRFARLHSEQKGCARLLATALRRG